MSFDEGYAPKDDLLKSLLFVDDAKMKRCGGHEGPKIKEEIVGEWAWSKDGTTKSGVIEFMRNGKCILKDLMKVSIVTDKADYC